MNRRHVKANYKSGLEQKVGSQIAASGQEVQYEAVTFFFKQPAKLRRYKPDFPLENGIVIETKGRFTSDDRQKHRLLKEQYPDLDIRFVFSNSRSRLYKGSPTTYAMWCDRYGFEFADKWIPDEWFEEAPNPAAIKALEKAQVKPKQ